MLKIIKKIILLDERTITRVVLSMLILVVIVWYCWVIWDGSLNRCYVMKETKDMVGTWKVRGSTSFLILHNNGTFEFHRPNILAVRCLPNNVCNIHADSCGKIACGKWVYRKKMIVREILSPEFESECGELYNNELIKTLEQAAEFKPKCGELYLGGEYSFITVGNSKRLRIISYQPSPDGDVLILDQISRSVCCPRCGIKTTSNRP
jgi:hypothetical protein